ncbi:MAG: aspartate 1-decarboxylase [Actinomycetota bacterium]
MRRTILKSKIHRARVTAADVDYDGSITLDPHLMKAADILPHEQVHVLDVDNGERFVTYAIEGDPSSGTVQVNGAAARLVRPGDTVIVLTYGEYEEDQMAGHEPSIVRVDGKNRVV